MANAEYADATPMPLPDPALGMRVWFTESTLTQCAWFPHPIEAKGSQTRFKVEVPRDYVPVWARPTSASSSETSK